MKTAVLYDSKTGNTKQAAEWIVEGMNRVNDIDAKTFSIESIDEEFIRESKGIVVGSPSYAAQMTPNIHGWLLANAGKLGFAGKLGGAFATEQYTHGGGTQVIHSMNSTKISPSESTFFSYRTYFSLYLLFIVYHIFCFTLQPIHTYLRQ